jgi:flagellar assembly factor FliW
LKAPLVINLDRRLGRQLICTDDQPMQFRLATASPAQLRRSA